MLYTEIIAVCSQIHTKHINTLCGQNVELLNVGPAGTYSDRWALKRLRQHTVHQYLSVFCPVQSVLLPCHSAALLA